MSAVASPAIAQGDSSHSQNVIGHLAMIATTNASFDTVYGVYGLCNSTSKYMRYDMSFVLYYVNVNRIIE